MSTSDLSCPMPLSETTGTPEEKISADEFLRREKAIKGTEERFLFGENTDEEGWRSEALAVIDDIQRFVTHLSISTVLPCDNNGIYLNLETKESNRFTIELSSAGFRVCGQDFDTILKDDNHIDIGGLSIELDSYYETPYSLLDTISPSYRNLFSTELAQRLMELCK